MGDHTNRLSPDDGISNGRAANDGQYTSTGLTLHGPWHDGIQYTKNTFDKLYDGAEVAGGTNETRLSDNSFSNCFDAAVHVSDFVTGVPTSAVVLSNNTMDVPDNPLPGGGVMPNATVRGILVENVPAGGQLLQIGFNTAMTQNPGDPAKPKIGLDVQDHFDNLAIQDQNSWTGFDVGVQFMDAGANTSQSEAVTDNLFDSNNKGVVLNGGMFAFAAPTVSCNTFTNNTTALAVPSSAVVRISGEANSALSPDGVEPAANNYVSNGTDVDNSGGPLKYYYYQAQNGQIETPIPSNLATFNPVFVLGGTPCNSRNMGWGVYGMNRPSAGGAGTSSWSAWENQISSATGNDPQIILTTLLLIDYMENSGQLTQLEAFANTLPYKNDAAFDRISLYLMERYRRLGQDTDVQRVHDTLLAQHGQNPQIRDRVAYFDVAGHLMSLAPGQRPVAADSIALAKVAGATTDFAPVACATLRYFYPACTCGSGGKSASTTRAVPRPAAAPIGTKPVRVQAYPNPAREQVTLDLNGLPAPAVQVELIAVATGQVTLVQVVTSRERLVLLVADIAPGVYQARLLDAASQTVGTSKIVVLR